MRWAAIAVNVCAALCALLCASAKADPAHTLYIDDDLFSGMAHDADYTGGIAMTSADDFATDSDRLHGFLLGLGRALGMRSATHGYELEIGAAAFTPSNVTERDPVLHDRPYAALVYVSAALSQEDLEGRSALTTLTVGALGLPFAPHVQRRIHHVMGSVQPKGWQHQISEGGEATVRLAHERKWAGNAVDFAGGRAQWLYRAGAGVGFLTDVSAGVALRYGRFSDLRWDLHSSPAGLSDRAVADHASQGDRFVYATVSGRVPIYNALLQGQFRDSDVTVPSRERRSFIPDMSLGFVVGLADDRELHYFIRAQRSDVRFAQRSDTMVYGGVSLSW